MRIKPANFDILVNEFIKAINKQLKIEGRQEVYDVTINTEAKVKTLKLYTVNMVTGERVVIYKNQYTVKNPAEFLTKDINYILYRELFYNCFAFYTLNMDAIVKQRLAERSVEEMAPGIKDTPITPDDAFAKTLRDAQANS